MSATNPSIRDEIWKLFQDKKVTISLKIKKAFPFFHILRDKQIISEENFQQCLKKVKSNPKAINEEVYNVLGGINSESALWAIFCEENLKEYPNLKPIFQDLKNGKRKQKKKNLILDFQGNELHVYCGKNARGVLYKDRLAAGILKKSIKSSDGKWFTPPEFEIAGGCTGWKNWKRSISCSQSGLTLEELIKRGVLTKPPRTRCRINKDSRQCLQKKKTTPCSGRCNQAGTSHQLPRTRLPSQNPQPSQKDNPQRSFHQVPLRQLSGSAKGDAFSSPELPVQCGAVTGKLYKHRFEAGPQTKCIRMEEQWCTPEEFVRMDDDISFESWDNDIRVNGVSLKELIKNGYLKIHPEDCPCKSCKEIKWPENDDQCYVCSVGGELFCCDSCPRVFHNSCHVPDVPNEKSFKWICTFCELKTTLGYPKTASYQENMVLLEKMLPKQTLRCQFLLLNIWCQHESVLFAEDPTVISCTDGKTKL